MRCTKLWAFEVIIHMPWGDQNCTESFDSKNKIFNDDEAMAEGLSRHSETDIDRNREKQQDRTKQQLIKNVESSRQAFLYAT